MEAFVLRGSGSKCSVAYIEEIVRSIQHPSIIDKKKHAPRLPPVVLPRVPYPLPLQRNNFSPRRNPSIRDRQQFQHPRKKSSDYYLPSLYIPAQDGHNSTTSSSSAYRSHRDETKWSSPIDVSKAVRSSFSGGSVTDPHRTYMSSSSAVCPSERSPPSLVRF